MVRFELCWILIGSHEKRLNFYWFTQIAKIRLVYERCQNNTSASYLVVNTKLQCDVVFFSFAYTTSPAAVMKLVVFFRSSKPPHIISGEAGLLMATVRFSLVGVCYISGEHTRLSGPPHHRDTLGGGKERFLVSCACVRWACCGQNAVYYTTNQAGCLTLQNVRSYIRFFIVDLL